MKVRDCVPGRLYQRYDSIYIRVGLCEALKEGVQSTYRDYVPMLYLGDMRSVASVDCSISLVKATEECVDLGEMSITNIP
jgi:hypothetical protein